MVRRFRHGLEVTPETLAYDVIANVGPEGHFLSEDHTVKHCRTAFWLPSIGERRSLPEWQETGALDSAQRARKVWLQLLSQHEPPPLDAIVSRQLKAYIEAQL